MTYVLRQREDSIAIITINRPEVLNALNRETLIQLENALAEVEADVQVRVVLLTGQDGAFSAGDDLREAATLSTAEFREVIATFQRITRVLKQMSKPVIAAVDGYALGGGLEIICACDLRVATDRSQFGCPEVNVGLVITNGSSSLLPRIIGEGRARHLVLTGELIDAAEAYRIGLVNQVIDAASLLDAAQAMAKRIATRAPKAIQLTKQLLDKVQEPELDRALLHETDAIVAAFATEDSREGIRAFLEKRRPQFQAE